MTTTRRARTTGVATALLVAASMLSGCGGKDAAADPPTASADASSTSDPSMSASASPASGPLLDSDVVSLHAPSGWKVTEGGGHVLAEDETALSVIQLDVIDNYGQEFTLQQLARQDLQAAAVQSPKVEEPVTVAAQAAYHVTGMADSTRHYEGFGFRLGDRSIYVGFTLAGSPTHRQQVVDSVLATVELK